MSAKKRKATHSSADLISTYDAIINIISRVKPKLTDLSKKDDRRVLEADLNLLASHCQRFKEQRAASSASSEQTDALDREGVNFWNTSGLIRSTLDSLEDRSLFATLRLAGFRLIEAGLELKPNIESLVNILQLASKTGSALSEFGRNDAAASVLGCAAVFEEQLRNMEDVSNGAHDQAKARAVILYFCSRMLAAWRDGNSAIAQFMLEKITESEEYRLSMLTTSDRELLAAKILEIGRSILKVSARTSKEDTSGVTKSKTAQDAVKWIQKAFTLIEKMEDTASPGMADLKRTTLRSLARAYYLSSAVEPDNLARAETTLQELVSSIENSTDSANQEHQQIRWMRLAVLKKSKAPESSMLDAFTSIIDHTVFVESEIHGILLPPACRKLLTSLSILQELRTVTQHTLVSTVLLQCIRRVLNSPAENSSSVDRFLLALLTHCAKDQKHARALKEIEEACSSLIEVEFELDATPAMASLTILWKAGDKDFQARKWQDAADWFLAGTHKAFSSISQMSEQKCLRKAALCYIEQRNYAHASAVIRRCPTHQASTFYLAFLVAAYQGLENEAVTAIESLTASRDFDKKFLLLSIQLAHESDLKGILLVSLEALLRSLRTLGPVDSEVEELLLIRCIIRLVVRLMKEAQFDEDREKLANTLIRHLKTAVSVVETAVSAKKAALLVKDVSWLWRAAYNIAVQGCAEWQQAEDQITSLFDLSFKLIQGYSRVALGNHDVETSLHMIYSSFGCLSARVFALRATGAMTEVKTEVLMTILGDVQRVKEVIHFVRGQNLVLDQTDNEGLADFLRTTQIFEVEVYCLQKQWDKLRGVISAVEPGPSSLITYEAITDILWSAQDCPVGELYLALEAILHACLDREALSVRKFSRWLRVICTILLARNSQTDRNKALTYVEQAVTVIEGSHVDGEAGPEYPIDERHWLMSTAYNTGVECLVSSYLDEAKRWFEAATVICRFVPDGSRHSSKISETYRHLLEQCETRE